VVGHVDSQNGNETRASRANAGMPNAGRTRLDTLFLASPSRSRDESSACQLDGSSGATGTAIDGASVPPSTSNTLPVTHDDASDTR
jgi:hypothetical protein